MQQARAGERARELLNERRQLEREAKRKKRGASLSLCGAEGVAQPEAGPVREPRAMDKYEKIEKIGEGARGAREARERGGERAKGLFKACAPLSLARAARYPKRLP